MHFALICHSGWALGVARRMLDELATLVRSKAGRPGTLADSTAFHRSYGEAEAKWHAARAFIYDTWRGVGETIAGGGTLSHEQRTMMRLALYNATWAAEAISVAVYRAAGHDRAALGAAAALLPRHARRHAARHLGAGSIENCGRALAGLAPGHQWLYMNLVPVAEPAADGDGWYSRVKLRRAR